MPIIAMSRAEKVRESFFHVWNFISLPADRATRAGQALRDAVHRRLDFHRSRYERMFAKHHNAKVLDARMADLGQRELPGDAFRQIRTGSDIKRQPEIRSGVRAMGPTVT